jgi:predicted transcriptional regulator
MLGEDFTDVEISRALHVAQSTVSNFRNGDQVDSESKDQGQLPSDNLERESEHDESLTDSEITRDVGIPEDVQEEPKGITFIGGKKKHKEPEPVEEEEFEYECPHCRYEFNSRSDTCPSCGGSLSGYDD